jgi:hypothetical protein
MKYIKLLLIFSVLAGSFSCESITELDSDEPVEVSTIEYSLYETGCWWINTEPNKVITINSDKELEQHIACSDNFEYPAVDFSKQTLLLTSGVAYNGVAEINSTFFQVRSEKYTWKIAVRLNTAMVVQGWHTAILVPKTNKAIIVTEVQQAHY